MSRRTLDTAPTSVVYYEGVGSNGRSRWLGPYKKSTGSALQHFRYELELPSTHRDAIVQLKRHTYDLVNGGANTTIITTTI